VPPLPPPRPGENIDNTMLMSSIIPTRNLRLETRQPFGTLRSTLRAYMTRSDRTLRIRWRAEEASASHRLSHSVTMSARWLASLPRSTQSPPLRSSCNSDVPYALPPVLRYKYCIQEHNISCQTVRSGTALQHLREHTTHVGTDDLHVYSARRKSTPRPKQYIHLVSAFVSRSMHKDIL
jgi:hypothetical protein